jgi:hypothetical protein
MRVRVARFRPNATGASQKLVNLARRLNVLIWESAELEVEVKHSITRLLMYLKVVQTVYLNLSSDVWQAATIGNISIEPVSKA